MSHFDGHTLSIQADIMNGVVITLCENIVLIVNSTLMSTVKRQIRLMDGVNSVNNGDIATLGVVDNDVANFKRICAIAKKIKITTSVTGSHASTIRTMIRQ